MFDVQSRFNIPADVNSSVCQKEVELKAARKRSESPASPAQRSEAECQRELATIDDAHIANEAGRDQFLALAHTALFAASIAFVDGLTGDRPARWIFLLIGGWLASVFGLLALTWSFHQARRHLDQRRARLYELDVTDPRGTGVLNGIALWSFPVALVATFVFATVNIVEG